VSLNGARTFRTLPLILGNNIQL